MLFASSTAEEQGSQNTNTNSSSTSSPSIVTSFEQLILSIKECFVYKVPPLRAASGHRAEEWGLDKPLFTGHLKIFQNDLKLRILLYRYQDETTLLSTPENLIQFAECLIQINPGEDVTPFVDSVADSSRYFVIKIKDPNSNRTAFLGIGFRERDTAFDFKNALNEYVRFVDRMNTADQMAKEMENITIDDSQKSIDDHSQPHLTHIHHKDLSIKDGEKIHVNVKIPKKTSSSTTGTPSSASKSSGGGGGGLLRPPPPPGAIVKPPPSAVEIKETSTTIESEPAVVAEVEDSDWGDFTSS